MPTLFYANSTKQDAIVCFRMGFADPNSNAPPTFRLVKVRVAAGAQAPIFKGDQDEVTGVILQLGRQKVNAPEDLDRRQTDLIHGVYSVDKPLPMAKIAAVIVKNDALRNDRVFMMRKQLAVATHYKMNERAMELGPDSARPNNVIMDLLEVPKMGDKAGPIETVEVATEGHAPRAHASGRRARKAA